ncbi:MAG TPA: translation initiation factor IF-2, partial [Clostridiales bacterium]|nr:translation initiation factor IF-2 [Clostridiales bacterium]
VTVMGHVDHGKTSLLDAIRKTNVVSGEAGGITQSIGAYTTKVNGRTITFIDTPGHAAFTAMRARGAQLTDIAVLVVAADDGIMPQTIEAINHIKAAGVPMIVAINKIDKPEANIDRVMKGLADQNVLPEEWGGDTICVPIAAKLGKNIDKLLEMILLVADVQDLKANPNRPAVGTIIESRLDKGKGPVASVLVQNGTLKVGDTVISGIAFGKVRAMMDENGKPVKKATPSTPVQILGLDAVPESGDSLTVVDEKMKNQIIAERKNKIKQDKINSQGAVNIDDLFNKADENSLKVLNIIIKADVQGSVEALKASLADLRNDEAKVVCVHSAVGNITESDVLLAQASNAIIIGFNVKCEGKASAMAEKNKIQIKSYSIIYECIDDVKLALKGMLAPKYEDKQVGTLEVRQIFKISSVGTIAGCYVLEGKITKNSKVHVIRNGKEIAQADVESLKVQKNEAKEVTKGFECGIKLKGFDDIKEFDQFVAFVSERVEI